MKSIIKSLVFLLIIIVLGCNSSDDNDIELESNLIVGVWRPVKVVYVCSGLDEIENSTSCEQTGRLTMRANGTWTETYYYEYDVCEYDGESNGTWKIVSDKLFVTEGGSEDIEITLFEVTENTLRLGLYDSDICDEFDEGAYYYGEYIRVK